MCILKNIQSSLEEFKITQKAEYGHGWSKPILQKILPLERMDKIYQLQPIEVFNIRTDLPKYIFRQMIRVWPCG